MPTIEQVSKRVFSDNNWLKKCALGGVLSLIPIVNIVALGYLYQIFQQGRSEKGISLPEWEDFKGLFLDGLRFLVIGLIFAVLPIAVVTLCAEFAFDGMIASIPLIPVLFMAGPLMSAALYLYSVKQDISDCFNAEALSIMLKKGAISYTVPTLAYLGLCMLGLVLLPFPFFFGGVFYFYLMACAFKDLEKRVRS
ncbi:DUF4013 domain-containing protein [Pelagicoccus sp. NFK12]|uniref:DUF4013 domain-containing protein n=1 Tax=Pelagicoccus enzymogenes TaxID=2773457 RepID=A0A927F7E3_9BACT|nr:DUF4013 domain-containing protein [Pelagicoccus enzymogenes]MBD5779239.1 DUF4013 domain-containing protein [Pelagicoccus enzymogenes]MDQ8198408.1 DUF4013 domain-containing protein [Pelagicoccus enzymogenes]